MNEVPSVDSMLNADLSGVDTSFPVLAAGVVPCVIAECVRTESKEKKTPMVALKFTTQAPHQTTTGKTQPAGFPLRDQVTLNATDNYDPRQRLAQIKEAVFGTKEGAFGDPAMYVGKPVTLRIKIEASEEYGNQNKVAAYVKLAQ